MMGDAVAELLPAEGELIEVCGSDGGAAAAAAAEEAIPSV